MFVFFRQDLGAETVELIFFSFLAVSPHLRALGLDSHLPFCLPVLVGVVVLRGSQERMGVGRGGQGQGDG